MKQKLLWHHRFTLVSTKSYNCPVHKTLLGANVLESFPRVACRPASLGMRHSRAAAPQGFWDSGSGVLVQRHCHQAKHFNPGPPGFRSFRPHTSPCPTDLFDAWLRAPSLFAAAYLHLELDVKIDFFDCLVSAGVPGCRSRSSITL